MLSSKLCPALTMDRGMGWGPIMLKVDEVTSESTDWSEDVVAAHRMSNLLTTASILLVSELNCTESSSEKLISGSHKATLAVP